MNLGYFEDFYDGLDEGPLGECEDCGDLVAEKEIGLCQFGFCAKGVCQDCGFRCERNCVDSVVLCSGHAAGVKPRCTECQRQFCDICTNVKIIKCEICSRHCCEKCQRNNKLARDCKRCVQCDGNLLRSLQETCRDAIRNILSTNYSKQTAVNIDRTIRDRVHQLPLPALVKDYICDNENYVT